MAVDWITLGAAIVDNSKSQKVQEDCLTLKLTLIADACLHYDMLLCVLSVLYQLEIYKSSLIFAITRIGYLDIWWSVFCVN